MKPMLSLLCLPAVLMAQAPIQFPGIVLKPVQFTVADETGTPVEGAFIEASLPMPGNAEGHTGRDGRATLQVDAAGSLTVYVTKNGYYTTSGELFTGGRHRGPDGRLVDRQLADAYTIELKSVKDPVALTRKDYRGRAPTAGRPVGFDLKAGDWVAPHGRGSVADLLFHFHDIVIEDQGFRGTMTMSFPNPDDGIQPFTAARPFSREFGSNLAPPHRAPVDGYLPSLSHTLAHVPGQPYEDYRQPQRNHLFRTRTQRDAAGRILQACYGWIQGDIEFDPRDPRPQLAFTYTFNADPDPDARGLEHDTDVR